jgi:hypothetical protein
MGGLRVAKFTYALIHRHFQYALEASNQLVNQSAHGLVDNASIPWEGTGHT